MKITSINCDSNDSAFMFANVASFYTGYYGRDVSIELVDLSRSAIAAAASNVRVRLSGESAIAEYRSLFIESLADERVRLSKPLPVVVQRADGAVVAYSFDADEMGCGETEAEAISELGANDVESYFILKAEQARLGPLQRAHWVFLSDMIDEVAPVNA